MNRETAMPSNDFCSTATVSKAEVDDAIPNGFRKTLYFDENLEILKPAFQNFYLFSVWDFSALIMSARAFR